MSDAPTPDETAPARPILRIVRGSPSADDLAVLAAVVAAASGGGDTRSVPGTRRGGWNDPGSTHRRELVPGPNAWRSALR